MSGFPSIPSERRRKACFSSSTIRYSIGRFHESHTSASKVDGRSGARSSNGAVGRRPRTSTKLRISFANLSSITRVPSTSGFVADFVLQSRKAHTANAPKTTTPATVAHVAMRVHR